MLENPENDNNLEDILSSIRGIIDDNNHSPAAVKKDSNNLTEEDNILELTNIFSDGKNSVKNADDNGFISAETERRAKSEINKFTDHLEKAEYSKKEKSLDSMVNNLMKPLVKEWLNNNLPRIVEKVVNEEIQKMIPKK